MTALRAAIELLLLSVATFAAAFVTRRMLLWDVKPVSWDSEPPQNGALEAAYLLLSIENIAAVVATIALVAAAVLCIRRLRQPVARKVGTKRPLEH